MDRRRFLRAAAAAGVPVALAGCTDDGDGSDGGDGGGGDGGTSPTDTDEPTPTPTDAEEPTQTDGETASPADEETPTETDTESPTATGTPTPEPDMEVTVAPGGSLEFEPESFTISAGDTVLWTWDGSGHNVKPDGIPDESDWSGTPGDNLKTYGSGYTYVHTFEMTGSYDYKCVPHQSNGMRGSFTVE